MVAGPDRLTPAESDDPGWHQYRGSVEGRPFSAEVSARWAKTADEAQAVIDHVLPELLRRRDELTARCADDLLGDYNTEWSPDAPLDVAQFRSRLELTAFGVMPDGHVRARVADPGLFHGHDVVADLDADLGYSYTMLE